MKTSITPEIKDYCKMNKIKFEKFNNFGFVGSWLVDVKAGMEYNIHTGNIINAKIRKIGTKRVFYNFTTHYDGDISYGEKIEVSRFNTTK